MDLSQRLSISYYKTVTAINEEHKIYLVQHQETGKIYVKKILDVYSIDVYKYLIDHPVLGIPRIYAFYEENNKLTLIEEFISGSTLYEKIESRHLTRHQICRYMISICDILEKLHSQKPPLVHRDIKPSNVIISDYDDVYLLDFNAAKYQSGDANRNSDTVLLGTQGYAAPEQYGFGESSPLTDIYSIGIVLREAVASVGINERAFDAIVEKCTQMEPSKRYQSVGLLKKDLTKALDGEMISQNSEKTINKFLPPGFRTMRVWKMIIAFPVYALITYITLTFTFTDGKYSTGSLWTARIFLFAIITSNILVICNYLGIQDHFPLSRSKYILIRIIGVIIEMTLVTLSLIVAMFLVAGIFFNFK